MSDVVLVARDADRVAEAAHTLVRIAERLPQTARVLRGTFFGGDGADLELQLDDAAAAAELAGQLGGLTQEIGDVERGDFTGHLMRRHMWIGAVGTVPVLVWAFELVDQA